MATKKKLLQAAAGAGGGEPGLNVEQVFSTYLYEGNGSSQTMYNDIDLGSGETSGSAQFDGTNDYLEVPYSSDFDFGTGDFTIEMWVWRNSSERNHDIIDKRSAADVTGWFMHAKTNGSVAFYMNDVNWGGLYSPSSSPLSNKQWNHIAVTRSGTTFRIFINGTQEGSITSSTSIDDDATPLTIGSSPDNKYWDGYISNLRIVKGTAVYTSNFTVPTSELTAISGTTLLTCQGTSPFVDNSSSSHTVTSNGDPVAAEFGPFAGSHVGEGGLVWIKNRDNVEAHYFIDTERGTSSFLKTNSTDAASTYPISQNPDYKFSFNRNGFSIYDDSPTVGETLFTGRTYASWTFRKAPKFFDVVTYTGDGTSSRTVSHNLGTTVGFIIIKRTDDLSNWSCYHRGLPDPRTYIELNKTDGDSLDTSFFPTAPTDTQFTVGSDGSINGSGRTYVAYLFAHNDGDGEFGPDGDQDIIKCGSFTGDSNGEADINLGFEPQWIMIKSSSADDNDGWQIYDTMRGIVVGGDEATLSANTSSAEASGNAINQLNATGWSAQEGSGNTTYIYIAIRRGPMAVPTDATDVFDIAFDGALDTNKPYIRSDLNYVDMVINSSRTGTTYHRVGTRLTQGKYLDTNSTSAETTSSYYQYDFQNGWFDLAASNSINTNGISWMWKRAPSFCDIVCYTGNGNSPQSHTHNLGVAPEMMWVKRRDSTGGDWAVYHKDIPITNMLYLNTSDSLQTGKWASTAPTSSVFTTSGDYRVGASGDNYIAYLFASLDGVSKVGSYTGNTTGTNPTDTQTIECGFSPRFVLVKATSTTGQWAVWDTERGIVAGDDPTLYLDSTSAEDTYDFIDPYATGFTITNLFGNYNQSGVTYIFYAIA